MQKLVIILKRLNRKLDLIVLLFIIFTIIILFVWLNITQLFFVGYGVTTGLDIYLKLKQSWSSFWEYLRTLNYYPFLYPLGIAFTHLVLVPSKFNPYIFNSILIFLLYFLSRKKIKEYRIFIFILLTTPGFYNFFRFPTMEYPLLFWIFFIFYFITASNLWRLKNLIILGIFLGMGFLIKWTFLAYISGLLGGYFICRALKEQVGYKRFIFSVILIVSIAIAVAGFWYFGIFNIKYFFQSTYNDPSGFNYIERFLFYVKNFKIISGEIYFWLSLLVLVILFIEKKWESLLVYLFPLIIGIGILAIFSHVEVRYLFPFVMYIALLQAEAIPAIRHYKRYKRVVRFIFFSIYLVFGILNIYNSFLSIPTCVGVPQKLKVSDLKIFSKKLSWFQIFMEEKKKLGRDNLIIATSPFNNCNNPYACYENIRYLLKLYQTRRERLKVDIIGFDSLEFKVFPYRIKDIDLLIVIRDVIYGDEQKFAQWREALRKFNAPFEIRYEELYREDPSYRNLILSNFKIIRKIEFISGNDILLFARNDLVKQKCQE